jgi:hypothetical protein
MAKSSKDERPRWARAIAPADGPRKFKATEVTHGHSASYRGKYAAKDVPVAVREARR